MANPAEAIRNASIEEIIENYDVVREQIQAGMMFTFLESRVGD